MDPIPAEIPAEIPLPDVLNPDRVTLPDDDDLSAEEYRDRARQLEAALRKTCDYGQALWRDLQSVREYLLWILPPPSRSLPVAARRSAKPEGPHDDPGWDAWMSTYTEVTSLLAGPRGDSGFAADEARRAVIDRRASSVDAR
jgi:hypothetical protein